MSVCTVPYIKYVKLTFSSCIMEGSKFSQQLVVFLKLINGNFVEKLRIFRISN